MVTKITKNCYISIGNWCLTQLVYETSQKFPRQIEGRPICKRNVSVQLLLPW